MSANIFSFDLRSFFGRMLPASLRYRIWYARSAIRNRTADRRLSALRERMFAHPSPTSVIEHIQNYRVRIINGPSFYMQYKDEFVRRIYHFKSNQQRPLIIDGGSNIGMSILYFKRIYPWARIIGFEPDPTIFGILSENVTSNGLEDVRLINAGLGANTGTAKFLGDNSDGGHLGEGQSGITVLVEQLSNYLSEPVDFLKLNIEGEELPVLLEAEASGKLGNIREMVLEYHGWPGREQRLGAILQLLDRQGFRYLIHDFDAETCSASKPPFRLEPQTKWFCLVYARKASDEVV